MKKLLTLVMLLALAPLSNAQLLETNLTDAKFKWESPSKDLLNMEAILKQYEEKTLKTISLSKKESPEATAYTGEAWYPLCEPADLERVKTKGLVTEKYLVPLGFELKNNYQMDDAKYFGIYYDGSSMANHVFIRLADDVEIYAYADVSVELTRASKYSVKLHEPEFKTDERGWGYYVNTKITDEQKRKASSSTGKYMRPDGNKTPGNDNGLERELTLAYSPKYYKLDIVFGESKKLYDCATPSMSAQGIKCGIAPVEVMKYGKQVIEFYLVPQLEVMAKDLKFVKEALDQAAAKK